jgi:hypothetical protein
MLDTYPAGSACAPVQRATTIDKVPAACAQAWKPYGLHTVPGQSLMHETPPRFPPVTLGPGVQAGEAAQLVSAMWRTDGFKVFALATRQLDIVDGLGPDHFFRQVSQEVQAESKGEQVDLPLCHSFPSAMRVVVLATDLAQFTHRTGKALGIKVTYSGPCSGSATDARGTKRQLYGFDGTLAVVYVGDVAQGDPLNNVFQITGLADCRRDVAKRTCVE